VHVLDVIGAWVNIVESDAAKARMAEWFAPVWAQCWPWRCRKRRGCNRRLHK